MEAGVIPKYLGFTILTVGDMDEDGLAIDGSSDRTCLAWHKDAVGLAEGIGARTEIGYIHEKTSWLVNAISAHGAVGIDATGIQLEANPKKVQLPLFGATPRSIQLRP